ncbi:hypothetical protein JCM13304A_16370 [Desulfothermus okinawensis JCM 13304]
MKSLEILKKVAEKIVSLDKRVVEVFIHSDSPKDPLKTDEIYLVCHLLDPEITHDLDAFDDMGTIWSLEITEKLTPFLEEINLNPEVIIMPFNYKLYSQGEYGEYYITLYLKEGYSSVFETADKVVKDTY